MSGYPNDLYYQPSNDLYATAYMAGWGRGTNMSSGRFPTPPVGRHSFGPSMQTGIPPGLYADPSIMSPSQYLGYRGMGTGMGPATGYHDPPQDSQAGYGYNQQTAPGSAGPSSAPVAGPSSKKKGKAPKQPPTQPTHVQEQATQPSTAASAQPLTSHANQAKVLKTCFPRGLAVPDYDNETVIFPMWPTIAFDVRYDFAGTPFRARVPNMTIRDFQNILASWDPDADDEESQVYLARREIGRATSVSVYDLDQSLFEIMGVDQGGRGKVKYEILVCFAEKTKQALGL